jgi:RNA polymerase sigma-70 factor (ECF subfamily)
VLSELQQERFRPDGVGVEASLVRPTLGTTGHTQPESGHAAADGDDGETLLLERAKRGDLDAYGQLVEPHRDVVFRVAARVVGPDDAEDVTQDALLRAFSRLDSFRGTGTFRAWLLTITHRAALNTLARRRPEPHGSAEDVESVSPAQPEDRREPVSTLEERERRRRLEVKLRELKIEHRTVLVLRDLEGLPYEDIATVTGSPLGTVKGRLSRARDELIHILRTNTYDWELPR